VRNENSGENMVINFEYTGGVVFEFSNNNLAYFRHTLPWRGNYVYAKVGMAGSSPYRILEPGENVGSPLFNDLRWLGQLRNELFRHLRRSVIPVQPLMIKTSS